MERYNKQKIFATMFLVLTLSWVFSPLTSVTATHPMLADNFSRKMIYETSLRLPSTGTWLPFTSVFTLWTYESSPGVHKYYAFPVTYNPNLNTSELYPYENMTSLFNFTRAVIYTTNKTTDYPPWYAVNTEQELKYENGTSITRDEYLRYGNLTYYYGYMYIPTCENYSSPVCFENFTQGMYYNCIPFPMGMTYFLINRSAVNGSEYIYNGAPVPSLNVTSHNETQTTMIQGDPYTNHQIFEYDKDGIITRNYINLTNIEVDGYRLVRLPASIGIGVWVAIGGTGVIIAIIVIVSISYKRGYGRH